MAQTVKRSYQVIVEELRSTYILKEETTQRHLVATLRPSRRSSSTFKGELYLLKNEAGYVTHIRADFRQPLYDRLRRCADINHCVPYMAYDYIVCEPQLYPQELLRNGL